MNDIEKLLAKDKIQTQLCLYCKGIDQRDWPLVRSCFGEQHHHRHGPFDGSLDEFISFASKNLSHVKVSQHSLSNFIITLSDDGLSAQSDVNFTAVHLIEGSVTEELTFTIKGKDTDWTVLGSYADQWVCENGQWLIIKRKAVQHWQRVELAKGRPNSAT